MADPREPIFAAIRTATDGNPFNVPGRIDELHKLLDAWGVKRAEPAGRKISAKGLALIHSFEGLRLTTYPDPGPTGLPVTGGYGTTRDENGRPFKLGRTEPKAYWDALFARDLAGFEQGVASLLGDAPTTQGQLDAMISMAYNVGLSAFGKSTLLRKHKAGDYAGAAAEFGKWTLAGGKRLNGLVRRRAAEAKLYRGE